MEVHGVERIGEYVHSDSQLSQDLLTEALKSFRRKFCLEKLICARKDVIVPLPTGFGKNIIYQLLPEIHKIKEDKNGLYWSIRRGPLSPGMPSENQIKTGEIDIVFGSSEKWLSKEWQKELIEGNLGKAVSEIAIDEVHVVLEW